MKLNAETPGVISSPFYPRRYPTNQKCSWQITASKGNRVKLVIEDMDIEECSSWFVDTCDYLEIQDGSFSVDGMQSGRIGRLIGSVTYYSFHESLKVLFVSDNSKYHDAGTKGRFKATYTQITYTASTGE